MRRGLVIALILGSVPMFAGVRQVAASQNNVQCTGTIDNPAILSGSYDNVIVPANSVCVLEGVTVRHDVIVESNGALQLDNSSVGHDVSAQSPWEIQTGINGPVTVGHDLTIAGSDLSNGAQGYDICDTRVGHDLRIADAGVQHEIEIGDVGPQLDEFCFLSPSAPDSIGHDLAVINSTAGKIDVGNNHVGHNLNVSNNNAVVTTEDSGQIGVDDNSVGHDATCMGNTPSLTKDGPEDGPNRAGHRDNGCA